jgi:hypothetical protein
VTAPQSMLTDAALDRVSTLADQMVARGLMSASSVEIETMRRLALEYRASRAVLQEIQVIVDAATVHSTSMPYVHAHDRIADLLAVTSTTRDEVAQLRAALKEACDWAAPFNQRHDRCAGGYASELLPMYTRVGDRNRADRLTELRKLTKDNQ